MSILEKIKEWGDFLEDGLMHVVLYDDGSGALLDGNFERVFEFERLDSFLESVPTKDKDNE